MTSRTNPRFWVAFAALPSDVQRQAREAYRRFIENPGHPGLHFRRVHPVQPIYSARISDDYRALGVRRGDDILWFWIGGHGAYERLLANR